MPLCIFLSLMSWYIAWSHCWVMSEIQSLLKVAHQTPTLLVVSWLCLTPSSCSGENDHLFDFIDTWHGFLPCKRSKTCLSLFSPLQTSADDCRSFTQSHSFKPAGVQTAEPHDLLQQRARYSGAAAATRFPRRPPGGASGLSSLLYEGPSGGYVILSDAGFRFGV